jgi:hypothetical protein
MVGAERARWGARVSMQSSEIITRDLRDSPSERKGMRVLVSSANCPRRTLFKVERYMSGTSLTLMTRRFARWLAPGSGGQY